ncbi:hypothetical protein SERLADRAFT_437656 [Serpula lacrymans var. lacrymans S7.9]|uniref:Uncharacterized protein n=1 Tax=Serpula lacrymans var. lacrymans (strain S7.9) TaxID=578457 RepID=F8NUT0_SERL9|nr:uncharacterized protein SERLADRAFT_437656 [Serpula lacrymans var. lacrymans S7.9]EGO25938.1 hypothetical protein SERLADRAFT_437656 [Serpula lacrymans var. lacrymans S7.9]
MSHQLERRFSLTANLQCVDHVDLCLPPSKNASIKHPRPRPPQRTSLGPVVLSSHYLTRSPALLSRPFILFDRRPSESDLPRHTTPSSDYITPQEMKHMGIQRRSTIEYHPRGAVASSHTAHRTYITPSPFYRSIQTTIPSSDLANRRPHELQKKRGQVMDPTVLPSWGEEEKSGAGINLITRRDAHSSTHAVVDIPSALSSPSACTHCPCPQRRRREPQPLPRCLNFLSQNSYSSKNVKPASFGSVFRNNVIILLNEHTPQVSSVTPELGAE